VNEKGQVQLQQQEEEARSRVSPECWCFFLLAVAACRWLYVLGVVARGEEEVSWPSSWVLL